MSKLACVMFAASFSVLGICGVYRSDGQATAGKQNTSRSTKSDNETRSQEQYTLLAAGNGWAGDGTPLSVKLYMSSDGTKVTIAHGHFKSSAAATAELERVVKDGKVLERASRQNGRGGIEGERALVRLSATESLPDRSAVLLTEGSEFYEVSSSSVEVAVSLAKRYYKEF